MVGVGAEEADQAANEEKEEPEPEYTDLRTALSKTVCLAQVCVCVHRAHPMLNNKCNAKYKDMRNKKPRQPIQTQCK
jgi:hypothetical protein